MERPPHIAEYPPHETGAEEEHVDERALFSWPTAFATAVMSIIGFLVGRKIGQWGDAPGSTLGRRVMGWAGALSGGFLAAYTSTKVIRKEQHEAKTQRPSANTTATPVADMPATTLASGNAEYEGTLSSAALERGR